MNELEEPTRGDKRGTHLVVILILCYLVSFAGSEGAMRGLGDWYPAQTLPKWAPPLALYVPIWTLLYGTVAVGIWQVWESREVAPKRRAWAIGLIVPTLLVGGFWPWVFFDFHSPLYATFAGALLWVLGGLSVWAFARVKASAGLLLIPYWAWSAYVTALAFALWHTK